MRTVLIGGIGNVLLGDDGVGPYVLKLLESQYSFEDGIELIDLGTPALDLTHQIAGLRSLILIDSVASDEDPGTVVVYRKQDILQISPAERLDPHSPALSECLLTAEMVGASPENVLLVGIVGRNFEPGEPPSLAVQASMGQAIGVILDELNRLGYLFHKKNSPDVPDIWWSDNSGLKPLAPFAHP